MLLAHAEEIGSMRGKTSRLSHAARGDHKFCRDWIVGAPRSQLPGSGSRLRLARNDNPGLKATSSPSPPPSPQLSRCGGGGFRGALASSMARTCSLRWVKASASKAARRPAFFRAAARSLGTSTSRGAVSQLQRDLDLCAVLHAAGFPVDLGQRQQELAAHDGHRAAVGVAVEGDGDFRALALPEALHHRRGALRSPWRPSLRPCGSVILNLGMCASPRCGREHIARFVVGERDPQG
jgi:hypothetical protein